MGGETPQVIPVPKACQGGQKKSDSCNQQQKGILLWSGGQKKSPRKTEKKGFLLGEGLKKTAG